MNIRNDVFAIEQQFVVTRSAQSSVQNGAMFGAIDFLAGKHGIALRFNLHFACEIAQQLHGFFVDTVFRIIEKEAGTFRG